MTVRRLTRLFLAALLLAVTADHVVAQEAPTAEATDLQTLSWLSGCWEAQRPAGSVVEVWMAPDGGLMVGMSRSVRGERATGFEFLVLRQVDDGVVLSAHPWGQAPTDFPATDVTPELLRVENPQHDSPQRIEYVRMGADSVTARVFGSVDDDEPAFQLGYGRCALPPSGP